MSHHIISGLDVQVGVVNAWHNLTKVVDKITEDNCGILYEMVEVPLFFEREGIQYPTASKQIISLDNGLPIGPAVNNTYSMISNKQIWDMVQEALAGTQHKIVSVGTVQGREVGFISVNLDENFVAAGRVHESNLNVMFGHSGKMGLIAKTGMTTCVCWNTVQLALNEKSDFKLAVKHTKNANFKILNMEKAIEAHVGVKAEFQRALDEIANDKCTSSDAGKLFGGFLAKGKEEELSTRSMNVVERLSDLFKNGKGNRGENFADAFNAVTDFYTHESAGENRWKQYESSEFGSGNKAKNEFYSIVTNSKLRANTIKLGSKVLV